MGGNALAEHPHDDGIDRLLHMIWIQGGARLHGLARIRQWRERGHLGKYWLRVVDEKPLPVKRVDHQRSRKRRSHEHCTERSERGGD